MVLNVGVVCCCWGEARRVGVGSSDVCCLPVARVVLGFVLLGLFGVVQGIVWWWLLTLLESFFGQRGAGSGRRGGGSR